MEDSLKLFHGPSNNYDDWFWDVNTALKEKFGEFAEVTHMSEVPSAWTTPYVSNANDASGIIL